MHTPVSTYRLMGIGAVLLALASCGSSSTGGDAGPTASPATARADRDNGPQCQGEDSTDGLHVLRGGGFKLPDDSGVQYTDGQVEGTTLTATLRDGARYEPGQQQWTVEPGSEVTVSNHAYTVRQICTYRVVLEPKTAADKTAFSLPPTSTKPTGSAADGSLCFTTNREVLKTAAEGFPGQGETLALLNNGGVQRFPNGLSITVSHVDTAAGTTGLNGVCAAIPVAAYEDVRSGQTVEFAGVMFKISALTEEAVKLTRVIK
ncbi:hypothetical protein [Streptomyces fungicidicus]|uniref:hypothetical protein n=1 Tax=Streptomyces fungicidicus TaxID=68203 RepID=UPI0036A47586